MRTLFHQLTRATSRPDGVLLVLLAALLLRAMWPFFGGFIIGTLAFGLLLSIVMRRWHDRHPATAYVSGRAPSKFPEINFSALPIGGDLGGLLVTAGCVALLLVGLPALRWYFAAAMICAVGGAMALVAWRRIHPARPPIHIV